METVSSSLLSTVLAVAVTFLALSLLVQVMQEVYKYLTSSRARTYKNTLIDFLGPHAQQLFQPGLLPDLQVRGPFQFLRRRPTGHLQPMDHDDLVLALERTTAPWVHGALNLLRLETTLQKGASAPISPSLAQFMEELEQAQPEAPGYATALELKDFFTRWEVGTDRNEAIDAAKLLEALRYRFMPSVVRADQSFTQLVKNFDQEYRRRNLRHSFVFGFLLAFVAMQPLDRIIRQAAVAPLEKTVAAAAELRAIYQAEAARDTTVPRSQPALDSLTSAINAAVVRQGVNLTDKFQWSSLGSDLWTAMRDPDRWKPGFLLGCLLTALLISFGAPFWNDLTGALLRAYKGQVPLQPQESPPSARAR